MPRESGQDAPRGELENIVIISIPSGPWPGCANLRCACGSPATVSVVGIFGDGAFAVLIPVCEHHAPTDEATAQAIIATILEPLGEAVLINRRRGR